MAQFFLEIFCFSICKNLSQTVIPGVFFFQLALFFTVFQRSVCVNQKLLSQFMSYYSLRIHETSVQNSFMHILPRNNTIREMGYRLLLLVDNIFSLPNFHLRFEGICFLLIWQGSSCKYHITKVLLIFRKSLLTFSWYSYMV